MKDLDLSVEDLQKLQELEGPAQKKRRLSLDYFADDASLSDEGEEEREIASGSEAISSLSSSPGARVFSNLQPVIEDRFGFLSRHAKEPPPGQPQAKPGMHRRSSSFASLGISRPLRVALGSISIKQPTEIQTA